ncbi:hypothetical protein FPV67DRAFT_517371 [Lyophyllum atratum]|nr:hypothetical protein FPV67DRAFT_517371 [Lyophyllum atratum]
MFAGPSNPPPGPAKRRYRLPNAGIAVLEAFVNETNNYEPSPQERQLLLHQIQAIPGCETYLPASLHAWFKRRRAPVPNESAPKPDRRRKSAKVPLNSPYPSLTRYAIEHLTTLSRAQPSPPPGVIQTWAELLHAGVEDIKMWLFDQQQLNATRPRSPVYHLPTPVSTSPEPQSEYHWGAASSHPYKTDPSHSPVIPSSLPPAFYSTTVHNQESGILSPLQLLEAIAEASTTANNPTSLPSSKEEFEAMFAPYESRIRSITERNLEYLKEVPQ